MESMKSRFTSIQRVVQMLACIVLYLGLAALNTWAQQPSPSPQKSPDNKAQGTATADTGDDASDYTIHSSMEIGVRGLSVDGNVNKYRSDLNYDPGVRMFDSTLLIEAKDGIGGPFDSVLATSTGWGSDPTGHMRIKVEKSEWYRFEGSYRRFQYFRVLNNIANPFYAARPTDPVSGQHSYDTRMQIGDFDLTILPKNERVRFNLGFSPTRSTGPAFTTWHYGGDDFMFLTQTRYRSNDFRLGADWKLGPVDFSFMQGFRRFSDDTIIDEDAVNLGVNPAANNAFLTSMSRQQPVRGRINYSRFTGHTLLAKKLDITGRFIYSSAKTTFDWVETVTGVNFNTRITNIPGAINPPNLLPLGVWDFNGSAKRPNTLGDFGVTYLATEKLRFSNTFRVETFQIAGGTFYDGLFNMTRLNGTGAVSLRPTGAASELTKYRKIQNTTEADYQFNIRYSVFGGYRYGSRHIERFFSGANLGSNGAPPLPPTAEEEDNHTNTFFGGIKARPLKGWTLSFDAERGTSDNVFTRTGNYDYWYIRARSRYAATRNLRFNLGFIARDNSNPSEVDRSGTTVSLTDFGVDVKSRVFTSSLDWTANDKLSFNVGYNYQWQNSDAIIQYAFNSTCPPPVSGSTNSCITGHSLYFVRNHYFNIDTVAEIFPRVTLYLAYRINKDVGQGDQISDPLNNRLVTSYPMSYQSPEGRVAIRLNRWLDWNLGYQYYNYNESKLATYNFGTFIVSPAPQNYHAHLPYTSLRIYFGRNGER
jgi:hypothetical protein